MLNTILPHFLLAIFIYAMPLSGVALAVLVLGEVLTAYKLLGAALSVYGIYKAESDSSQKRVRSGGS